jgi:hypothetical protein
MEAVEEKEREKRKTGGSVLGEEALGFRWDQKIRGRGITRLAWEHH